MTTELRAPSLEAINPGDPTVQDLFAVPVSASSLNFWRGKRFVKELDEFVGRAFTAGSTLASVDVHKAALVLVIHDAEGQPASMPVVEPGLVEQLDPATGRPDPGPKLYSITQERGFGMVYDAQDQSARPEAYDSFKTAIETVVMSDKARHLRRAVGISIAQMAEDKFDRTVLPQITTPMPRIPQ